MKNTKVKNVPVEQLTMFGRKVAFRPSWEIDCCEQCVLHDGCWPMFLQYKVAPCERDGRVAGYFQFVED